MNGDREEILSAIKGSGAIMSTIASRLGVDWHTARKYCNKWESTKQALLAETERTLDMAEGTLLKSIEGKDVQSAKWYLSTKGKHRGYSEKHEIEHGGQIDIKIGDEWEDV